MRFANKNPASTARNDVYGVRDASDNKFVALALYGEADYRITGDHHLLELGHVESVQIVTPADFLARFEPPA